MLPAEMAGGVSAARAANLEVTGEALSTFVKRVDSALRNLEGSAGDPTRIGAQRIKPSSLNSGSAAAFPEAHALYLQYNRVHEELTSLSKTLHLQIEAIGIAVRGAHVGFDNLEEEQRRRFAQIQTQIKQIEDAKSEARSNQTATSGSL
ncbi:hypothetical protein LMJ38_32515 [Streptomyces sp. R1]|uniref:hypothetical protein n=1 Tax=Streptomyces TaxID=1883 RepID=UPI001380BE8B|nr:hypothetical protein [Streptomyces sp. R1]MCC8340626.1 hypothetical protein [Streptomyces sp. R1]MYS53026.1 hypothetical protein [Streptomyces sp. SID6013]